MNKKAMDFAACEDFLRQAPVGRFTTVDHSGAPYTVPVHYVYLDGTVYIHGSTRGRKGQNLAANPKACFEIDEMEGLLYSEEGGACQVNTRYRSVIACGEARIVADEAEKRKALDAIVAKFTPVYEGVALPDKKVQTTGVIAMRVSEISGKRYPHDK